MKNINNSNYVFLSRNVDSSRFVDLSSYVSSSTNVDSSRNVDSSSNVDLSSNVDSSRIVDSSSDVMFCYDIKSKEYEAFNKPVTEGRLAEIKTIWDKIKGDFKLELKDNSWKDEWKKLPQSAWVELSKLPEFDKKVVENIIGFELNLETTRKMTVKEISEKLGYEVEIINK